MIGHNEKCLNPWHGFFIILAVCIVILVGIFSEFQGKTHHSRVHRNTTAAMAQAAFARSGTDAQQPAAGQITF